jgi:ketosteroid isomerase-like protein
MRQDRQGGQHDRRRRSVAPTYRDARLETLVADNSRWQTMLADDVVWELPFAPALGHPARVSGRAEVVQFAAWFVGAVENFRFFDVRVQAFADPEAAVVEVKGEGRIKATGRSYRQEYVVFLRAVGGKIAFLREYFDPTRAAKAFSAPILDHDIPRREDANRT